MDKEQAHEVVSDCVKKHRIVWIDCCRVLCMFSIVYGHSLMLLPPSKSPWTGPIMGWFWDACAPCVVVLMFFFLSGWLQKTKCQFLDVKKFLYLAIPVVIWNGIQILVEGGGHVMLPEDFMKLGIVPIFTEANGPLWFLDELAWFSLFLPLINRMPTMVRTGIVIFGFIVVFMVDPRGEKIWNPYLKFAMDCLFFMLGTLLNSADRDKITCSWLKIAPWVALLGACYIWSGMFGIRIANIPTYTAPYALVGLACLLSYGATIERIFPRAAHKIAVLAPAVFFIYASHWPMFTLWNKVETHFGLTHLDKNAFPLYTIVCFALCILIWYYAQKLLPAKVLEWVFLCKKPRAKETP